MAKYTDKQKLQAVKAYRKGVVSQFEIDCLGHHQIALDALLDCSKIIRLQKYTDKLAALAVCQTVWFV